MLQVPRISATPRKTRENEMSTDDTSTASELRPRSALGKVWDWFSCSDRYLASLPTEALLERSVGKAAAARIALGQRDVDDSIRDRAARATAEAERLGRRYRERVIAQAVKDTARLTQLEHDQQQRELLHPLKRTGRYELPVPGE
jgi:hypothetical protein